MNEGWNDVIGSGHSIAAGKGTTQFCSLRQNSWLIRWSLVFKPRYSSLDQIVRHSGWSVITQRICVFMERFHGTIRVLWKYKRNTQWKWPNVSLQNIFPSLFACFPHITFVCVHRWNMNQRWIQMLASCMNSILNLDYTEDRFLVLPNTNDYFTRTWMCWIIYVVAEWKISWKGEQKWISEWWFLSVAS